MSDGSSGFSVHGKVYANCLELDWLILSIIHSFVGLIFIFSVVFSKSDLPCAVFLCSYHLLFNDDICTSVGYTHG